MNLLLFDIDGTLMLPGNAGKDTFFDTFEQLQQTKVFSRSFSDYKYVTDSNLINELYLHHCQRLPTSQEIAAFKSAYLDNIYETPEPAFRPVEGAKQCFEQALQLQGWTVSLATGNWYEPAIAKLMLGVDLDLMGFRRFGCASTELTAKEGILKTTIEQEKIFNHNQDFEKVVYVGDTLSDLKACLNLDIALLGINTNPIKRGRLTELGAKVVLSDLTDFDQFRAALHETDVPLLP